jgi:hypothetical protein
VLSCGFVAEEKPEEQRRKVGGINLKKRYILVGGAGIGDGDIAGD